MMREYFKGTFWPDIKAPDLKHKNGLCLVVISGSYVGGTLGEMLLAT